MIHNKLKRTVLIIEDEPQIRKILNISLSSEGYNVVEAHDGREGLKATALKNPDIIILDLGLPDMDGKEVIQEVRQFSNCSIIILSVRSDEINKITCLDLGANDYITKPFNIKELMARMRSTLRDRVTTTESSPVIQVGRIILDLTKRIVKIDGKRVNLSPKEYGLLSYFMKNIGNIITHEQLLKEVWGMSYKKENQYLRVYIGSLRTKIEPISSNPIYILTEPGVGYRMVDPTKEL